MSPRARVSRLQPSDLYELQLPPSRSISTSASLMKVLRGFCKLVAIELWVDVIVVDAGIVMTSSGRDQYFKPPPGCVIEDLSFDHTSLIMSIRIASTRILSTGIRSQIRSYSTPSVEETIKKKLQVAFTPSALNVQDTSGRSAL